AERLAALALELLDAVVGLEVPLIAEPLEEHERQDIGLVILAGRASAQDGGGTSQVGFELLLGQASHEPTILALSSAVHDSSGPVACRQKSSPVIFGVFFDKC